MLYIWCYLPVIHSFCGSFPWLLWRAFHLPHFGQSSQHHLPWLHQIYQFEYSGWHGVSPQGWSFISLSLRTSINLFPRNWYWITLHCYVMLFTEECCSVNFSTTRDYNNLESKTRVYFIFKFCYRYLHIYLHSLLTNLLVILSKPSPNLLCPSLKLMFLSGFYRFVWLSFFRLLIAI